MYQWNSEVGFEGGRGLDVKVRHPNWGEGGVSRKSRIASDFRILIPSLRNLEKPLSLKISNSLMEMVIANQSTVDLSQKTKIGNDSHKEIPKVDQPSVVLTQQPITSTHQPINSIQHPITATDSHKYMDYPSATLEKNPKNHNKLPEEQKYANNSSHDATAVNKQPITVPDQKDKIPIRKKDEIKKPAIDQNGKNETPTKLHQKLVKSNQPSLM